MRFGRDKYFKRPARAFPEDKHPPHPSEREKFDGFTQRKGRGIKIAVVRTVAVYKSAENEKSAEGDRENEREIE